MTPLHHAGKLCAAVFLCIALSGPRFVPSAHAAAGSYVVRQGDTLSGIAQTLGVSVPTLLAVNHLSDANRIAVGQVLYACDPQGIVPMRTSASATFYLVRPGDTLSAIAQRYGVSLSAVASANSLADASVIVAGQQLTIPAGGSSTPASTSNTVFSQASVVSGTGYVVKQGDTLSGIALSLGVTPSALASANNIADPTQLQIGASLTVPSGGVVPAVAVSPVQSVAAAPAVVSASGTYMVNTGDTLSAIAQRFGVSLEALVGANGIQTDSIISVGQQLTIPGGTGTTASAPASSTSVSAGTIESILTQQALAAGVDVSLVKAVAWQESGWQMVTASDGGMGVMQLMPDSVDWAGNVLLGTTIDPYNATDNIRAGVAMLHYYLGVFGNERDAIAAYHQGMTSIQTSGISAETEGYLANVLALQQRYAG